MALKPPRGRWLPGLYIGTTDVLTRLVLPPAGRCPDAEGGCLDEDERRGKKIQNLSLFIGQDTREDGGQSGPCGRGWSERRGAPAVKSPEGTVCDECSVKRLCRWLPHWVPGSTHHWRENVVAQCQYTVVPQLLFPSTPFEGKLETADCRTPSPLGWGKGVRPSAAGL